MEHENSEKNTAGETFFHPDTPAGQSEEIASLMEQIPMLDIMALNKFFPKEE